MNSLLRRLVVLGFVSACGPMEMTPDGGATGGGSAGGLTAGGSTAGGSAAGGSTAGGSTAGGSTAGGSTAGGSTAGGSTAGGSTAGGSTAGGSTAGGSTAGGSTAGGSTAGGSTAGGSTAGGSTAGGSAGGGSATVRFATQIAPILAQRCGAPCHNGQYGAAATAYTRLTGMAGGLCAGRPRMVAGNAGMSLVYQKITNAQTCGVSMPQNAALIPLTERNLIRDWINQGALNN